MEYTIYFGGLDGLRLDGKLFRFENEDEARVLNESINIYKKEGSWPGAGIVLVNMADSRDVRIIPDYEVAQYNWKGFKKLSFDQAFLIMAGICIVVLVVLYLFLRTRS